MTSPARLHLTAIEERGEKVGASTNIGKKGKERADQQVEGKGEGGGTQVRRPPAGRPGPVCMTFPFSRRKAGEKKGEKGDEHACPTIQLSLLLPPLFRREMEREKRGGGRGKREGVVSPIVCRDEERKGRNLFRFTRAISDLSQKKKEKKKKKSPTWSGGPTDTCRRETHER